MPQPLSVVTKAVTGGAASTPDTAGVRPRVPSKPRVIVNLEDIATQETTPPSKRMRLADDADPAPPAPITADGGTTPKVPQASAPGSVSTVLRVVRVGRRQARAGQRTPPKRPGEEHVTEQAPIIIFTRLMTNEGSRIFSSEDAPFQIPLQEATADVLSAALAFLRARTTRTEAEAGVLDEVLEEVDRRRAEAREQQRKILEILTKLRDL